MVDLVKTWLVFESGASGANQGLAPHPGSPRPAGEPQRGEFGGVRRVVEPFLASMLLPKGFGHSFWQSRRVVSFFEPASVLWRTRAFFSRFSSSRASASSALLRLSCSQDPSPVGRPLGVFEFLSRLDICFQQQAGARPSNTAFEHGVTALVTVSRWVPTRGQKSIARSVCNNIVFWSEERLKTESHNWEVPRS